MASLTSPLVSALPEVHRARFLGGKTSFLSWRYTPENERWEKEKRIYKRRIFGVLCLIYFNFPGCKKVLESGSVEVGEDDI